MGQSLAELYVHLVFSTKGRARFLGDVPLRERLHAYIAGICRNLDSPAIVVGGVEDHVHVLCRLGKQTAVSNLVREIKRDSSKWIKSHDGNLAHFYWQDGYGAFSVSPRPCRRSYYLHRQPSRTSPPRIVPRRVPPHLRQIRD